MPPLNERAEEKNEVKHRRQLHHFQHCTLMEKKRGEISRSSNITQIWAVALWKWVIKETCECMNACAVASVVFNPVQPSGL